MKPGWKKWKHGALIPDQHEPGNQRGYMAGKQKKNIGSEHHSNSVGSQLTWPVGKWAGGFIDGRKK